LSDIRGGLDLWGLEATSDGRLPAHHSMERGRLMEKKWQTADREDRLILVGMMRGYGYGLRRWVEAAQQEIDKRHSGGAVWGCLAYGFDKVAGFAELVNMADLPVSGATKNRIRDLTTVIGWSTDYLRNRGGAREAPEEMTGMDASAALNELHKTWTALSTESAKLEELARD